MHEIELNRDDLLTLIFHLKAMRNSVKKGLKKKHSRAEFKKHMQVYDSLFESFPRLSDDIDKEQFTVELSSEQYEFMQSFLEWYANELRTGLKDNVSEKEQMGLEMLQEVKRKVDAA